MEGRQGALEAAVGNLQTEMAAQGVALQGVNQACDQLLQVGAAMLRGALHSETALLDSTCRSLHPGCPEHCRNSLCEVACSSRSPTPCGPVPLLLQALQFITSDIKGFSGSMEERLHTLLAKQLQPLPPPRITGGGLVQGAGM